MLKSVACEGCGACIAGLAAEFFFNAHQLVVLCNTVTAAHRTGLNLPRFYCDGKVGDKRILGFA